MVEPRDGDQLGLDGRTDPAQPGQRRPAARRRPAGDATWCSTRTPGRHLAPRALRHRAGPGRHPCRRPARRGWPIGWRSARDDRADDRRASPPAGPQAGRQARPRRAAACAVLPLHGPGAADGQGGGQRPDHAGGRLSLGSAASCSGRPLASEEEIGERLSKTKALAIFSSDAISSSAYATEEILRVLILGGAARRLRVRCRVSIAIAGLLVVVAFSYRQICIAYPTGGGSYSVSQAEHRQDASLVAASALLIDYILTVAVSTSSAVEQIVSAFPALFDVRVIIGVGASRSSPSPTCAACARPATSSPSRPTCSSVRR